MSWPEKGIRMDHLEVRLGETVGALARPPWTDMSFEP